MSEAEGPEGRQRLDGASPAVSSRSPEASLSSPGARSAVDALALLGAAPAGTRAEALAAGRAIHLQRAIGNRALSALVGGTDAETVQREGSDETGPPTLRGPGSLTDEQRTRAKKKWGSISGFVDEGRKYNAGDELGATRGAVEAFRGSGRADPKTQTAAGAYYASQMGRKDMIGDVAQYKTIAQREGHLKQFLDGAHAFITNDAYLSIHGEHSFRNFNAWGQDSNFVSTRAAADRMLADAAAPGGRGIFHLEHQLGVNKRDWVNACRSSTPPYSIWRFLVLKPEALNIRIPSGNEGGAYQTGKVWKDGKQTDEVKRGEWRPGGSTLGGAAEAVIDPIKLTGEAGEGIQARMAKLEADGILKRVLDGSLAANTLRVLAEEYPDEFPAPAPVPNLEVSERPA